jgi:hypothetical protein
MNHQVFDKGARPALRDTDNVLPLIDGEKTEVSGEFAIISKAGPPLFECPNVSSALCVTDLQ